VGPSLDDLKAHLNITDSDNDDELLGMLDAATDVTESIVGPLAGGTVTETHYGLSSDVLVLRQVPVAALVSVSGRLWPDGALGTLRLVSGYRFAGDVTVTYTTGREAPAAVRLAVLIIAAHLWETQRGSAPVGPLSTDDGTVSGLGFAIPNRARELLAPFAYGPRVS
jgi:hypothetical protein